MIAIARPWPVMPNSEFARPSLVSEPFEPDEETRDIDFGDDEDCDYEDDYGLDEDDFDTELDEDCDFEDDEPFEDDTEEDEYDECPDAGYLHCPCPQCNGESTDDPLGEFDPLGLTRIDYSPRREV